VLVDSRKLRQAEHLIESCEHCNEDEAQIPFDWILDRVLGSDSTVTDYLLEAPRSVRTADERFSKKHLLSLHNLGT
jgi:hypothetical protein